MTMKTHSKTTILEPNIDCPNSPTLEINLLSMYTSHHVILLVPKQNRPLAMGISSCRCHSGANWASYRRILGSLGSQTIKSSKQFANWKLLLILKGFSCLLLLSHLSLFPYFCLLSVSGYSYFLSFLNPTSLFIIS